MLRMCVTNVDTHVHTHKQTKKFSCVWTVVTNSVVLTQAHPIYSMVDSEKEKERLHVFPGLAEHIVYMCT